MKTMFIFLLACMLCTYGNGQKVQGVLFDCLDDIRSMGNAVQYEIVSDTVKVTLKTYGACETDFDIRVKEREISGITNVFFDIYDKCEVYQEGKLECGCLFLLQFNLPGYELKPNFRGFIVNNKTVPKKVWEDWFWENLD